MGNRQTQWTAPRGRAAGGGFTLVELLVVIGIIALLIGILLPSLARAREASLRTACSAKLHAMMLAAVMHANDHQGFYPLVGLVPGRTPASVDDQYLTKYDYLSLGPTVAGINAGTYDPNNPSKLAGIVDALSTYMGHKKQILNTSNATAASDMYDASGFIRNFLCPAQTTTFTDLIANNPPNLALLICPVTDTSNWYSEPQSYVYNGSLLGYYDPYGFLRGRANQVRQPSLTMFAADGLHGSAGKLVSGDALYVLYNVKPTVGPVTVGAAYQPSSAPPGVAAGEPACFDKVRHQNKINIAFCDGHVETRAITYKDLQSVYLLPPP